MYELGATLIMMMRSQWSASLPYRVHHGGQTPRTLAGGAAWRFHTVVGGAHDQCIGSCTSGCVVASGTGAPLKPKGAGVPMVSCAGFSLKVKPDWGSITIKPGLWPKEGASAGVPNRRRSVLHREASRFIHVASVEHGQVMVSKFGPCATNTSGN